jgi:hypothetical protein
MTDPFVTGTIEGRVGDTSPRRSEELHMLQFTTVSDGGNWWQDGDEPVEQATRVQIRFCKSSSSMEGRHSDYRGKYRHTYLYATWFESDATCKLPCVMCP